ncbi:MAG: OmpA family protein [Bacteroidales bacterium]|nr:OmpA family protein [Bacteroidales bacterium]
MLRRIVVLLLMGIVCMASGQEQTPCPQNWSKRSEKQYQKAVNDYRQRRFSEAIRSLSQLTESEPEFVDAFFLLGLIYTHDSRLNVNAARRYFERVIQLCPEYDPYAYYHLSRIYYGAREYGQAFESISRFLDDVDRIRSDDDYDEAIRLLEYSRFYDEMLNNPVPFEPKAVPGISTDLDEYLPIISPDNEQAFFTRKFRLMPGRDDLVPRVRYQERFMHSNHSNGGFAPGNEMPFPFNRYEDEGGATITIDNRQLFYTVCQYNKGHTYYNCDICSSSYNDGVWEEITNLGDTVNREDSWESQPSITSDGKTLYFVSDRPGGAGGYDIYRTTREENGSWSMPENLGPPVNTPGNEKSPFIHTDSQTLYFSSDGLMGLGGYDIFYSRRKNDGTWSDPVNIGYPINSYDDDVGFFVSTDGHYGYFASNKFEGMGGWDLYYFELYEKARPEKVLFLKGKVSYVSTRELKNTRIELKNVETRKITQVPVDTVTGEYVAAVLFRNDYIMTVKKRGFVFETHYLSRIDPRYSEPARINLALKPIEIDEPYRLNDIYFGFNSFELTDESKMVLDEFFEFLAANSTFKVAIHGHTDNVGSDEDNMVLSKNRARSVLEYLVFLGLDRSRLDFRGFGESIPIASNETEEGRALNRRTEFVIRER